MKNYTTVLSIAGSDSIGGAGIQADIKACQANKVYAMTAITAVTAQNTKGVKRWRPVPAGLLKEQLEAVIEDVRPDAVKVGMLPNARAVNVVARWLKKHSLANVVVDPVLVATSGHALSDQNTVDALLNNLFPVADIVTPNHRELFILSQQDPMEKGSVDAGVSVLMKYCRALLVKGGDCNGDLITDLLYTSEGVEQLCHDRLPSINTHGTGCTLSSAIACFLAKGYSLKSAVSMAIDYTLRAIEQGIPYKLGHGHGPLNHSFF